LREISGLLKSGYDAERIANQTEHTNIIPLSEPDRPWTPSRRLALAAALALFALIGAVAIATVKLGGVSNWASAGGSHFLGIEEISNNPVEGQPETPILKQEPPLAVEPAQPQNRFTDAMTVVKSIRRNEFAGESLTARFQHCGLRSHR